MLLSSGLESFVSQAGRDLTTAKRSFIRKKNFSKASYETVDMMTVINNASSNPAAGYASSLSGSM